MGFSITSPDLESLAADMSRADPVAAYHRAAARVGDEHIEGDIASAFRDAGASDDLIDDIGTYIHGSGSAYVGIPGTSRHAATAHELEFGSPFTAPFAPVRNTTAANADDYAEKLSAALDSELGAALDGRA